MSQYFVKTRMHSSRKGAAHLQTVRALEATSRCRSKGGAMNKFEHVSSDDHQMSVVGAKGVACLGGRTGGGVPCLMSGLGGAAQ